MAYFYAVCAVCVTILVLAGNSAQFRILRSYALLLVARSYALLLLLMHQHVTNMS